MGANRNTAKDRNVLFVTNRKLLIEQPSDDMVKHGIAHGIIISDYTPQLHHRIQLATIQSLERATYPATPADCPPADLIIIDEAHANSDSYIRLLKYYPAAKVVLLTATPVGGSGKTLIQDGYAEAMHEGVRNSALIQMGFLLPTRVFAPSEPDLTGVRISKREEYSEAGLGKRIAEVTCFGNVFDEWAPFADRQTIVFSPSIAYANGLVHPDQGDSFYARGIPAAVLTSKLKTKERDEVLGKFRDGEIKILVSVDMLREGFDCPNVSCAIDLQPNNQLRTYWQKVGRIKRPFPGQEHAIYIDMAGNSWKFPHPDDDPQWPTGDETTQDVLQNEFDLKTRPRNMPLPALRPRSQAAPKMSRVPLRADAARRDPRGADGQRQAQGDSREGHSEGAKDGGRAPHRRLEQRVMGRHEIRPDAPTVRPSIQA